MLHDCPFKEAVKAFSWMIEKGRIRKADGVRVAYGSKVLGLEEHLVRIGNFCAENEAKL